MTIPSRVFLSDYLMLREGLQSREAVDAHTHLEMTMVMQQACLLKCMFLPVRGRLAASRRDLHRT
jgi:hypothetical protein